MGKQETLETIWEVPDELWERVRTYHPARETRPRPGAASALTHGRCSDGIIFRLRSGCQWNRLPKELGDDSTIHRTFQRWVETGVLHRMWGALVEGCEELDGVDWEWQSADGAMGKARFGGTLIGPNPTDRGKAGTKRSLLVDGEGGPLSIVVAGANVHDAKLLRGDPGRHCGGHDSQPTEEEPQHLCLDKGYDNPSGRGAAARHGYREHIRRIGEEKLDASGDKRYPARRWVVERTLAWLSKCRAVLRPIRQEGGQLPRSVTARMCAPVVPPTVASGHFEIVT